MRNPDERTTPEPQLSELSELPPDPAAAEEPSEAELDERSLLGRLLALPKEYVKHNAASAFPKRRSSAPPPPRRR